MKSKEFLDILTRVVNSRSGPRFLEVLHELREILEAAGIAEEAAARIEPGKPIRRRSSDDVDRRAREAEGRQGPASPSPDVDEPRTASESSTAPAAPPIPAPAQAEGAEAEQEVSAKFIEAGPNRLIRNPEAPPAATTAEPSPPPARKESVRAIVQEALEGGAKTMAQLKERVQEKKGQVSHLTQQIHTALGKIGARRGPGAEYSLSSEDPPSPGAGSGEPDAVEDPAGPDEAAKDPGEGDAPDDARGGGSSAEASSTGDASEGLKQLNLLEGLAGPGGVPGERGAMAGPAAPGSLPAEAGSADPRN